MRATYARGMETVDLPEGPSYTIRLITGFSSDDFLHITAPKAQISVVALAARRVSQGQGETKRLCSEIAAARERVADGRKS